MKNNNNSPIEQYPTYQQPYQNDEIDLRELFLVIWQYKWLTVVLCSVAIIASVFYALYAQESWKAEGRVIKPQLNDIATFFSQIQRVTSVLNSAASSDEKLKLQGNQSLFAPNALFELFINEFNSSLNKKRFLEKLPDFNAEMTKKNVVFPVGDLPVKSKLVSARERAKLDSYMKNISAKYVKNTQGITLTLQSTTQVSSAKMLNDYIAYINQIVKEIAFKNLTLVLNNEKKHLSISLTMAEQKAKQDLALKIKNTESAYKIASAANINNYMGTISPQGELFSIHLGTKALKAQLNVLKTLTDLSIINPSIIPLKLTAKLLNGIQFNTKERFRAFRYLKRVEEPSARLKPKRALIVFLATLMAGILSVFIGLTHHFIIKKEEVA